jgi:Uncharacterised protein family (UPF0158)
MRAVSQKEIQEIAEQLDCGFNCFLNIKTNKLLFFPDEDNGFSDTKFWKEEKKELKKDFENFKEIDKPDTRNLFEMMESFVENEINDENFKNELFFILKANKPFRNFKFKIDNSEYRENWFAYKAKWVQEYVQAEVDFIFEHHR